MGNRTIRACFAAIQLINRPDTTEEAKNIGRIYGRVHRETIRYLENATPGTPEYKERLDDLDKAATLVLALYPDADPLRRSRAAA